MVSRGGIRSQNPEGLKWEDGKIKRSWHGQMAKSKRVGMIGWQIQSWDSQIANPTLVGVVRGRNLEKLQWSDGKIKMSWDNQMAKSRGAGMA